jgi:hypothetical protein
MAGKPLWRRVFDGVERPIGTRLEQAVQTERFADVVGLALRARAEAERQVERASRQALHLANLPAASDVVRLREQVVSLDRHIRRLEDTLRRQEAASRESGGADGPDSRSGGHGGQGASRRRSQPAKGPQRSQVRDGDRSA